VPTDINEIETWTLQRVITTATALADSGEYHDFTDIDYALRFEHGWIQARALIDDAAMRMLLNQRCAQAWEARVSITLAEVMPEPVPAPVEIKQATPSIFRQLVSSAFAMMPSPSRWRAGRAA
jgi:hypothetical protein